MIQDTATRIALCEREHGIDTSIEECLKELKFGLVEVVYEWASGMVSYIYLHMCRHSIAPTVYNLLTGVC